MIYTDGIHVVADTLEELHAFCGSIGIGRHYFEGVRKGHPHYDIPELKLKYLMGMYCLKEGISFERKRPREILALSKLMVIQSKEKTPTL